MTAIERRLARELHEAAAGIEAGSVPPLVLPPAPARPGRGPVNRRRHLTPRMLAPLAAAASVLAIAGALAALGPLGRSPGGPSPATRNSVLRSVPRYYAALTEIAPLDPKHRHIAGIYLTRTGALVASIPVPAPYRTFADVSAAADDRTFALAAKARPQRGLAAVMFYLASYQPGERSVGLTALKGAGVPAGASYDGFALSPDGRMLAVAYQQAGPTGTVTEVLRVLNIAAGTARTWSSTQGTIAGAGLEPNPLSWSANGRTLAFAWYGTGPAAGGGPLRTTGVRLLRIASPSSGLVRCSHLSVRLYDVASLARPVRAGTELGPAGFGRRLVAAAGTARSGTQGGFTEFSVATGRRVRTLWWRPIPAGTSGDAMAVLWASRSGRTLVVSGPPGHPDRIAVLRPHRLILLPGSARIAFPAAAW